MSQSPKLTPKRGDRRPDTLSDLIFSNDLAQSITPKFSLSRSLAETFARRLSMCRSQGEDGAPRPMSGSSVPKRSKSRSIGFFASPPPAALELGNDVEVVRSPRDSLVPSDFSVLRDGKIVAAIECKAHRSKRHRRYLIEILSMAALRARAHPQAFLIVPDTWEDSIAELSELVRDLGLQAVAIAAFSEDAGKYGELSIHRLSGG